MSAQDHTDQPEPPHYLVQRIREALAHDHRVGELELEVTVRAGKAFVSGTVPSEEVRLSVTEVLHEVVPELEAHNQSSVASFPEAREVESL
ncbi:MAG TPA: BON domain-containing protein [Actinomycetota bacterium]|nr:BON domain-containing protein [Actinomycetota bacterium]